MEILAFFILLALVGVIAVALVVLGLGGAVIVANHYHQPGEDVPDRHQRRLDHGSLSPD